MSFGLLPPSLFLKLMGQNMSIIVRTSIIVRGLVASVDDCCSGFSFTSKVSRWESDQHLFAWENSHQRGCCQPGSTTCPMTWRYLSIYLNICLNQTLSSRLTFYGCKFWKIATKVARLLGVRTQENASYVSKHWFFNGKRTV